MLQKGFRSPWAHPIHICLIIEEYSMVGIAAKLWVVFRRFLGSQEHQMIVTKLQIFNQIEVIWSAFFVKMSVRNELQ